MKRYDMLDARGSAWPPQWFRIPTWTKSESGYPKCEVHKPKTVVVPVTFAGQTVHHGRSWNLEHISMVACMPAGETCPATDPVRLHREETGMWIEQHLTWNVGRNRTSVVNPSRIRSRADSCLTSLICRETISGRTRKPQIATFDERWLICPDKELLGQFGLHLSLLQSLINKGNLVKKG
jgi:hypothetical protein